MKSLLKRLTVIFLITSFLTFLSLVSFASVDEETQGKGILGLIAIVISKLFYVLRFPTHTLFFQSFSSGHLFFVGLAINIIFWTTIIYLATKYLKK